VRLPTDEEGHVLLIRLVERLAAEVHPHAALGRARGLVCRMTKGVCGGPALRDAVTRAPSIDALLAVLRSARLEQAAAVERVPHAQPGDVDALPRRPGPRGDNALDPAQ
jgi:hypothetical protein